MPDKVILKVIAGKLKGNEYVFDERTTCLIGRAHDCNPRLPDDEAHRVISRHHCLVDINPPQLRIRDLGSLNGTYVNGEKIGQRERSKTPKEVDRSESPEYDLKDSDEIKLGKTILKVVIHKAVYCSSCEKEILFEELEDSIIAEDLYRCSDCRKNVLTELYVPQPNKEIKCSNCGRDVTDEIGQARQGDYVCKDCRSDPIKIAQSLVEQEGPLIKGYSIIKELGKGGMGAVYLAVNNKTHESVALKMMLAEVAVNEHSRNMFLREVKFTSYLKHPNVVQLLDYGNTGGTFYFTLEYCDGGSVDKLMATRGGKLSVQEATTVILQALEGLHYAHTVDIPDVELQDGSVIAVKGVVHRDIKPSNLFLSGSNNTVKIADFGLGKAFDAAGMSGYTRTGLAAGTPVFMPRQQVINFKYARPEIDVWSMMATFYYLLTGRFPRDFPKGKDPWWVVLQTQAVSIRKRDASIPDKLAQVIDESLIDQPSIKYKSAAQVKSLIEEVI